MITLLKAGHRKANDLVDMGVERKEGRKEGGREPFTF